MTDLRTNQNLCNSLEPNQNWVGRTEFLPVYVQPKEQAYRGSTWGFPMDTALGKSGFTNPLAWELCLLKRICESLLSNVKLPRKIAHTNLHSLSALSKPGLRWQMSDTWYRESPLWPSK